MKLTKIIAYGFEAYGFDISSNLNIKTDRAEIQFIALESKQSLDACSGVIVPSGIFERFKKHSGYSGTFIDVDYKRDLLLQREREIINLRENSGWICLLLSEVVDKVPYGDYERKKCNDTDLAKIVLNALDIERESFDGSTVSSKNDEFIKYIKKYGVAKTVLKLSYKEQDRKVLAAIGDHVTGVEFFGGVYFLPFHTTDFSVENAKMLVTEICTAILDYRQKRLTEVPGWVNEFIFEKENTIKEELKNILDTANQLQEELSLFKSIKGMLVQSGDVLKDTVISILKNYFLLNVTDDEDFKEDALIRDKEGKVLIVIEIKGTKQGVKRKYINQLDSNRERIKLTSDTPGLLIINDQMDVESIQGRQETSVADEIIKHAKASNILILRTIDLLLFMKCLEKETDRGKQLLDYCLQGGGRFLFENGSIKIVT